MMKIIASIVAGCAFAVVSTSAGLAGSPDNPGGLGQTVNSAKESWQGAAGHSNGWGQAVKANNQAGFDSLGKQLQSAKESAGASPNPANDNGGGND